VAVCVVLYVVWVVVAFIGSSMILSVVSANWVMPVIGFVVVVALSL